MPAPKPKKPIPKGWIAVSEISKIPNTQGLGAYRARAEEHFRQKKRLPPWAKKADVPMSRGKTRVRTGDWIFRESYIKQDAAFNRDHVTPIEIARKFGVSRRAALLWIDQGVFGPPVKRPAGQGMEWRYARRDSLEAARSVIRQRLKTPGSITSRIRFGKRVAASDKQMLERARAQRVSRSLAQKELIHVLRTEDALRKETQKASLKQSRRISRQVKTAIRQGAIQAAEAQRQADEAKRIEAQRKTAEAQRQEAQRQQAERQRQEAQRQEAQRLETQRQEAERQLKLAEAQRKLSRTTTTKKPFAGWWADGKVTMAELERIPHTEKLRSRLRADLDAQLSFGNTPLWAEKDEEGKWVFSKRYVDMSE